MCIKRFAPLDTQLLILAHPQDALPAIRHCLLLAAALALRLIPCTTCTPSVSSLSVSPSFYFVVLVALPLEPPKILTAQAACTAPFFCNSCSVQLLFALPAPEHPSPSAVVPISGMCSSSPLSISSAVTSGMLVMVICQKDVFCVRESVNDC